MKRILFGMMVVLAVGIAVGRWSHERTSMTGGTGRTILYYQSPMHPWIRSDHPGKCTVCGMDLVPIYEGARAIDSHLTVLGSNAVTVSGLAVEVAGRGTLHRRVHFIGVLDDDDTRHEVISATAGGRIDWLADNFEGAEFRKGQALVRLYSPALLAGIREYLGLHREGEGANGSKGLQEGALLRLRQMGLSAEQISRLPSTYSPTNLDVELLAPRDGTVIKRLAYPGQYVREGDPLFEIGDFGVLWLKFDAYERDLPSIQVGHEVAFTVTGHPGLRFTNAIVFIDPNIDPMSRTAKVRALVPNPLETVAGTLRRRFAHRSAAEVDLTLEFPETVTVPRSAVLNPGGKPRVFIERAPGNFEARWVRLGQRGDDQWEVLEGVTAGERVVVQGAILLDSQSQLAGLEPSGSARPGTSTDLPPLPEWLVKADALRAALAADDLEAYRSRLAELASMPPPTPVSELTVKAVAALPRGEVTDLTAARRLFLPFSEALVGWGAALRRSDPSASALKLYVCPMGKGIFPGAPPQARWLQLSPPLANPWYGARMLDCGSEIAP
jgi:membrane fusion protein, copper/silver efflux system